jgi:excisionase family DNA binding protein
MHSEYLTYEQAGEYLGLSSDTLRRWVAEGKISKYQVNHKVVRLSKKDLDEFMQSCYIRAWGN